VIAPRIAAALRRTGRIATDRPRATLWLLFALTAALFAVGAAGITAVHVGRWTRVQHGSASMVVYLGDGVDESRARTLAAELGKAAGVEHAELVTAADSVARLQRALGGDASLFEGVEISSLPASVEVTLAPGVRDVIAMSPILRELRGTRGVDDVIVEDAGTDRVAETLRTVRLVTWTGAALLSGLALIVVLASIRVRLDRAEREYAVAQLLGAGPSFVIVPTALAGALQGTLAALLAAGGLYAGIEYYGDRIEHALAGALGSVEVALPAMSVVAMFVAAGAVLGFIGGSLAGASRAVR
jgi:cell division transport system permease protein